MEVPRRPFSAQYEQSEMDKMLPKGQSSLSVEVGKDRLGRLASQSDRITESEECARKAAGFPHLNLNRGEKKKKS